MSNLKQRGLAWRMYLEDGSDWFPQNPSIPSPLVTPPEAPLFIPFYR